jgi:hypothetical protein
MKEFKKLKNRGDIYGRLDADMTMFVKETARKVEASGEKQTRKPVSLVATHDLGMALLRFVQLLGDASDDVAGSDKVHGLVVLTATLVQAVKNLQK